MNLARYLVQGVDVWMNTPRRPNEASGTSGMKAALNGVLNFSVLDGWWREAYNGHNGWAIGEPHHARRHSQRGKCYGNQFHSHRAASALRWAILERECIIGDRVQCLPQHGERDRIREDQFFIGCCASLLGFDCAERYNLLLRGDVSGCQRHRKRLFRPGNCSDSLGTPQAGGSGAKWEENLGAPHVGFTCGGFDLYSLLGLLFLPPSSPPYQFRSQAVDADVKS